MNCSQRLEHIHGCYYGRLCCYKCVHTLKTEKKTQQHVIKCPLYFQFLIYVHACSYFFAIICSCLIFYHPYMLPPFTLVFFLFYFQEVLKECQVCEEEQLSIIVINSQQFHPTGDISRDLMALFSNHSVQARARRKSLHAESTNLLTIVFYPSWAQWSQVNNITTTFYESYSGFFHPLILSLLVRELTPLSAGDVKGSYW